MTDMTRRLPGVVVGASLIAILAACVQVPQGSPPAAPGLARMVAGKSFAVSGTGPMGAGSATQYFYADGDWGQSGVHPGGRTSYTNRGKWTIEGNKVCAVAPNGNSRSRSDRNCYAVVQDGARVVLLEDGGGRWIQSAN